MPAPAADLAAFGKGTPGGDFAVDRACNGVASSADVGDAAGTAAVLGVLEDVANAELLASAAGLGAGRELAPSAVDTVDWAGLGVA